MATTTPIVTSDELSHDTSRVEGLTREGPVMIADGDEPSYVLLSIEDYRRLTRASRIRAFLERMGQPPGVADIELEIPPRAEMPLPVDLA